MQINWKAHLKYKRKAPLKLVYKLLPDGAFETFDHSPTANQASVQMSAAHMHADVGWIANPLATSDNHDD